MAHAPKLTGLEQGLAPGIRIRRPKIAQPLKLGAVGTVGRRSTMLVGRAAHGPYSLNPSMWQLLIGSQHHFLEDHHLKLAVVGSRTPTRGGVNRQFKTKTTNTREI